MRKIVRIAAITLAVLLLAAVALPFLIDVNVFRPRLEAALGQALGRDLKLGSLKLTILSGAVAATDLEIAEDPAYGAAPFVRGALRMMFWEKARVAAAVLITMVMAGGGGTYLLHYFLTHATAPPPPHHVQVNHEEESA